jgi:uncharacterized repeat protein (TIGR01451 family)
LEFINMKRLVYIALAFSAAIAAASALFLALPKQQALAGPNTPHQPNAALITKSAVTFDLDGDGKIGPGDEIAYSVIATNTGTTPLESVGIQDMVDQPVSVLTETVHASGVFVYSSETLVSTDVSILPPSSVLTLTFRVRVKPSYSPVITETTNRASFGGNDIAGFHEIASSNTVATALLSADVRAIKEAQLVSDANGNGTLDPNDEIAYTITVSNAGGLAAQGIRVDDTLPQGRDFSPMVVPITGTVISSQGVVTVYNNGPGFSVLVQADLGPINAGASATLRFRVRAQNNIPHSLSAISNYASIATTANGFYAVEMFQTNTVATPVTPKVDLSVGKGGYQLPGDPATRATQFSIGFSNLGTADATGIVITESLPVGSVLDAGNSTSGWVCTGGTCTFAVTTTLPPGQYGQVDFVISPTAALPASVDTITNVVHIGDDGTHGPDPNPANNVATATAHFGPLPVLSATKQAVLVVDANGDGQYSAGDVISYVLSVRNIGTRDAHNLRFYDALTYYTVAIDPASATVSQGTKQVNYNSIDGNLGTLVAGGIATITFRATDSTEPPFELSQIENQARFTDNYDNVILTNRSVIPVYHAYRVRAVKSNNKASSAILLNSERITYTVVVTNTGDKNIGNMRLVDNMENVSSTGNKCMNVFSDTIITSRGSYTYSQPYYYANLIEVNAGSFAVGEVMTLTFQAKPCFGAPVYIENQAIVFSDTVLLGYSNSISNSTKIPPELSLFTGINSNNGYATLGEIVVIRMSYGNNTSGSQYAYSPANGVVITQVVPTFTIFDASASAPTNWDCPNGSIAGTACRYFHPGVLAPYQHNGTITFAVRLNSTVPATLTRILNTASIGDDGASGTEYNLQNNTTTRTAWLAPAPITNTQVQTLVDTNGNGRWDNGEKVHSLILITNTSSFTLSNLIYQNNMLNFLQYVYASGVITQPSGVSLLTATPFANISQAIIDFLPPGGVITITFDAQLSGLYAYLTSYSGPSSRVIDEYETVLLYWSGSSFPTHNLVPTPTPTMPPSATFTPTPTPTVIPKPTSRPLPALRPRVHMPLIRKG